MTVIPSKCLCEYDLWPRAAGWPQMEIRSCVSQSPHPTPSACYRNQNHEPSLMTMLLTWKHLRLKAYSCIITTQLASVKLPWQTNNNLIDQRGMCKLKKLVLVSLCVCVCVCVIFIFFNRILYSPVWPRILLSLAWTDTMVLYLPSK